MRPILFTKDYHLLAQVMRANFFLSSNIISILLFTALGHEIRETWKILHTLRSAFSSHFLPPVELPKLGFFLSEKPDEFLTTA